jgi:hypothetical protein
MAQDPKSRKKAYYTEQRGDALENARKKAYYTEQREHAEAVGDQSLVNQIYKNLGRVAPSVGTMGGQATPGADTGMGMGMPGQSVMPGQSLSPTEAMQQPRGPATQAQHQGNQQQNDLRSQALEALAPIAIAVISSRVPGIGGLLGRLLGSGTGAGEAAAGMEGAEMGGAAKALNPSRMEQAAGKPAQPAKGQPSGQVVEGQYQGPKQTATAPNPKPAPKPAAKPEETRAAAQAKRTASNKPAQQKAASKEAPKAAEKPARKQGKVTGKLPKGVKKSDKGWYAKGKDRPGSKTQSGKVFSTTKIRYGKAAEELKKAAEKKAADKIQEMKDRFKKAHTGKKPPKKTGFQK